MSDDEDLLENPFFIAIKASQRHFSEIERDCLTVLVPSISSLEGVEINTQLLDSHVYLQSAMDETQYTAIFDPVKVIEIKGHEIKLISGFPQCQGLESMPVSRPISSSAFSSSNGVSRFSNMLGQQPTTSEEESVTFAILFEEVFYNKSSQPYRVLCIEQPLLMDESRVSASNAERVKLESIRTFDQCRQYLFANRMNELVLTKLEQTTFRDFLLRVSEYGITNNETELSKKCIGLVDFVRDSLVCANAEMRDIRKNKRNARQLDIIVETWVFGYIAPTIFSNLMKHFDLLDREMHRVILANQGLTLQDLNVSPQYICDYSSAIAMTQEHFDIVTSPLEKLYLFQEIFETIQECISYSWSKSNSHHRSLSFSSDANVLSTDEIISILVFIILQAKPRHLNTQLFFAKNFTRTNLNTTPMGFHLVNFTAAAEFLKSDHLYRSKFNSIRGNEEIVGHPLDPVRSPIFDAVAAGLQQPTQHKLMSRRSMSYLTPPAPTTISPPPENQLYSDWAVLNPSSTSSSSAYPTTTSIQTRHRSSASDHFGYSGSTGSSDLLSPSPKLTVTNHRVLNRSHSEYTPSSTTQAPPQNFQFSTHHTAPKTGFFSNSLPKKPIASNIQSSSPAESTTSSASSIFSTQFTNSGDLFSNWDK